jgi:hypothetical protein
MNEMGLKKPAHLRDKAFGGLHFVMRSDLKG